MSKGIRFIYIFISVWLLLSLSGCGMSEADQLGLGIYYINLNGSKLQFEPFENIDLNEDTILDTMITSLHINPDIIDLRAPASEFPITSYHLQNGNLILNFGSEYLNIEPLREIVIRDAIVSTLSQIKNVEFITIYVNDAPLTDSDGSVVGALTDSSFIDDSYQIFDTYHKTSIVLYFANEAGNALVKTTREVVYESSVSKEKLVVEELLKGPGNKGFQTINPETEIISVTNNDGICYVSLSENFRTLVNNVRPEIMVYSIVNSLAELTNVTKIQILINGETAANIAGDVTFAPVLERKLDLVE